MQSVKQLPGEGPAGLNRVGVTQAVKLGERLDGAGISAVYSSPLARAVETARQLACKIGLSVEPCEALQEIDYGDWTGCALEDLARLPDWRRFNSFRGGTRPPG